MFFQLVNRCRCVAYIPALGQQNSTVPNWAHTTCRQRSHPYWQDWWRANHGENEGSLGAEGRKSEVDICIYACVCIYVRMCVLGEIRITRFRLYECVCNRPCA